MNRDVKKKLPVFLVLVSSCLIPRLAFGVQCLASGGENAEEICREISELGEQSGGRLLVRETAGAISLKGVLADRVLFKELKALAFEKGEGLIIANTVELLSEPYRDRVEKSG